MVWFKILLALFVVIMLAALVRFVRAALRFKRSFDDFSAEAGQRLLHHAEQVDSTLERWHEYDEAYQEAVAKLEEEDAGREEHLGLPADLSRATPREARRAKAGRGATLGPTGASFRPSTLARDGPSSVARDGERKSNHERKSNRKPQ